MDNRVVTENSTTDDLFKLHRKYAVRSIIGVAIMMLIVFSVGLHTYVMTINSASGAFWPAVPMFLGVVFAYTGLNLKMIGRSMLIASVVFLAVAACMCFIAAIADGATAQSIHHTDFGICFYAEVNDYIPPCINSEDTYYNSYPKRSCSCCSKWSNAYISTTWYNVDSCETISHSFQGFLWSTVVFNIISVIACVLACASIGAYISLMAARNREDRTVMANVQYVPTNDGNMLMTTPPQQQYIAQPKTHSFQVSPTISSGARTQNYITQGYPQSSASTTINEVDDRSPLVTN